MRYDLLIDLSDLNEIQLKSSELIKVESLKLVNVTNTNIMNIGDIPANIKELCIEGSLIEYVIPDSIVDFQGSNLGLKDIIVNKNLEWLTCRHNELKTISLNENIKAVYLDDNKLEDITAQGKLNSIMFLSIQNNKIKNFDLLLPNTVESFDIEGNDGIRIKYLDFIFSCDENDRVIGIIDGDYKYVLGNGILAYDLFTRNQVAQWCYTGRKYIDLNSLRA